MKKQNIIIALLAVICCISVALAGVSLYYGLYAEENIRELYSCYELDNQRMKKLQEEIREKNDVNYINDFGDLFHANGKPVQQGYITVDEDFLVIEAGTFVEVAFAENMIIPENNHDATTDRYYYFENPNEVGYLVVSGVESGFAIVTVVKGCNK